jgi:hypothetical protein
VVTFPIPLSHFNSRIEIPVAAVYMTEHACSRPQDTCNVDAVCTLVGTDFDSSTSSSAGGKGKQKEKKNVRHKQGVHSS